jgi:CheY-like chemotaxis protein
MNKSLIEKLSTKNILVIDDDGLITRTLCNLLKNEGYYATGTEDSADGAQMAQEEKFDLIIADIRMPGMDGVEMIKKIRTDLHGQDRPDVPVVFITGYSEGDAVQEAKHLGEVIFKPFDTTEFLNRITKYL